MKNLDGQKEVLEGIQIGLLLNLITHWPFEEKQCVNENKTMTGKSFLANFYSLTFYTAACVERILCTVDVLRANGVWANKRNQCLDSFWDCAFI